MKKLCLALIVVLVFSLLATVAVANGFAFGLTRDEHIVRPEGLLRAEQVLSLTCQRYNNWIEGMGQLVHPYGDELWVTLDSTVVDSASFGPLEWSTRKAPREDGKCDDIRPADRTECGDYIIKLKCSDYHMGGNSIYLYETIRRGRQVVRRFLSIPVRRNSNDTTFTSCLQFTVVECSIPIQQRTPENMSAWLQIAGGAGIPPKPEATLALLDQGKQQWQQQQIQVATAANTNNTPVRASSAAFCFNLKIKASCSCDLVVRDCYNGQVFGMERPFKLPAKTTVVTLNVTAGDHVEYMIPGHRDWTRIDSGGSDEVIVR